MDDCKKIIPTPSDCSFALDLCTKMSEYYHSEEERKEALYEILIKHLPHSSFERSKKGEGKCDIVIDKILILMMRVQHMTKSQGEAYLHGTFRQTPTTACLDLLNDLHSL
jgi:hypothetical protein